MDLAAPTPVAEDPILLRGRLATFGGKDLKSSSAPILNLLSHCQESLLNIGSVLR